MSWIKDERIVPTKTLTVGYNMSEDKYQAQRVSSIDYQTEMKYEIAQNLATQLLEEDMIEIQQNADPYAMGRSYEARLTVADAGIHKVIVDRHFYEVEGIEFTHKDITAAIRNWRPELFL